MASHFVTYGDRHQRKSQADRDAEFRQMVDDAKANHNISDVVRRHAKVKRANKGETVALCLFHSERSPSMRLNDAKGSRRERSAGGNCRRANTGSIGRRAG